MSAQEQDRRTAREDLCRLLAACYYEPGPLFTEERLFESLSAAAIQVDAVIAEHARRLGSDYLAESPDALLRDYARLFLGPSLTIAPPYESVWIGQARTVMGDSTLAVVELYEQAGFDLDDDFREPPDHIAAELEFLYLLIYRENAALRTGDRGSFDLAFAFRKRLLQEHLARWVDPFTDALAAGAHTAFYKRLAECTRRLVALEMQREVDA